MSDTPSKRMREAKKRRKQAEKQERKRVRKLEALTTKEGGGGPLEPGAGIDKVTGQVIPETTPAPIEPPEPD